jgi:hypothetical protein
VKLFDHLHALSPLLAGAASSARADGPLLVFVLFSVPGDILQILGEMSWDTLLLLVGLGFVAVAVLGNISGKISPGKGGRIAAAIVGAGLIAGGWWLHNVLHGFEVTDVAVAPIQPPSGQCPVNVDLDGAVDVRGSGDVIYYFDFSNGNASPAATAHFDQTGSKILRGVWEVHQSLDNATVRLHVMLPEKAVSKPSTPFSVTCEPAAPSTGGAGGAPKEVPAMPAPASAPPVHAVDTSTDSVALDSITPKPGTYLKRGRPITFNIDASYNLGSADSAILSISTVQLRTSAAGCRAGSGELVDAVEVPIVRGTHQVQVRLTWSGDTGSATKGRIYGSGYLSFSPVFWASNNGARGARLDFFGTYSEDCYQFGQ